MAQGCYLSAAWLNHLSPHTTILFNDNFLAVAASVFSRCPDLPLLSPLFPSSILSPPQPPTNTLFFVLGRHLCQRQQIPTVVLLRSLHCALQLAFVLLLIFFRD